MRLSTTRSRLRLLLLLLTAIQFTNIQAQAQDVSTVDFVLVATGVSTSSPSPTTLQPSTVTSSAGPATHTVQVGLLDHKMRPGTTEAAVGDIVEFDFYPLNHSIVRAEYGFPCIPYEMTGFGKTGFFSGFHPVDKVLDIPPKYSIRINDTEPIFFYCSAPGSCITYGMVGGINLNSSMSIDKQRTLAMDSTYMLQPGTYKLSTPVFMIDTDEEQVSPSQPSRRCHLATQHPRSCLPLPLHCLPLQQQVPLISPVV